MVKSPARKKNAKSTTLAPGQKSLTSFFSKGTKTNASSTSKSNASSSSAKKKFSMSPKYRLKLTQVKHRAGEREFLQGKLVGFDGDTGKYSIQLQGEENTLDWSAEEMEWGVTLYDSIGKTVKKYFDDDLYEGTVVDAEDGLFRIEYEDGDKEDFSSDELKEGLELAAQKKPKKRKAATTTTTRRGRTVKPIKEDLVDTDNEDDESEAEEPKTKRNRRTTKEAPKKKSKKSKDSDDDGSAYGDDDAEMDEAEDDNDMDLDEEDNEDEDEEEEEEEKPKKKGRGKSTKKAATKEKTSKKAKEVYDNPMEELEAHVAKSTWKPKNNPQKWLKTRAYVDPVGVDPTHGIIEGIITNQVRKIGGLLLEATKNTQSNPMALSFPLKLQTACSGTDAPSIALGLIQESLDKLCRNSDSPHGFCYTHEMSCEIEPFKQAYIGRNFPGVPLFPDITKLTSGDQVLDVYGRPRTIPEGNLFVAGTSCKDFSMLKTQYRKDIEDKGTSGQTFLAAVEFLDQKQPPVAIFENVENAPWAKMEEYIQGRIDLKNRNDTKALKDEKKKGDADNELKFSVNTDGRYVAESIPRQVGMRAGDVVEGFVKANHKATRVTPLVHNGKAPKDFITLGELAKMHGINLNEDTLIMEKKARYCTKLFKLDTKDYGLPQTRNRKYLFIWRSDDPEDDLGEYFEEIMEHLKTPLLHSMDAFLLPDDHDRIRCFREALRSGPGLLVKRERAKELDFFDYELSRNKDTKEHIAFRRKSGIGERDRYMTHWDTRARHTLAPGLWHELFSVWNHRRLDMIDCFTASAFRDAYPRDARHHSFTWDLSQNVTRAPFRSGTVGVSGCVTPGGELLLPHKGRTVMGREKLSLQGIPADRLQIDHLTEVQQSDLAGNAMSVSVVCATMLAAICAPELRRARESSKKKAQLTNFVLSQKYDDADGAILAERGDLYNSMRESDSTTFMDAFERVAKDLAVDAFRSSVLCTCESSGTCSEDPKILECKGCGMGVCGSCYDHYNMEPHKTEVIDVAGSDGRPDQHDFDRRLRAAVPSTLRLGEGWSDVLKDGEGLESYSFQLQKLERKKRHYTLTYGAWEDFGSGRQVAEIRVDIGKLGALDSGYGVAAYVRNFAPSIRDTDPLRGKLKDNARLIYKVGQNKPAKWEFPDKPTSEKLKLVGSDPTPSQRVLCGLNDEAGRAMKNIKPQKQYQPPFESRNDLFNYHPKWKTFPGTIEVSGDSSNRVNGIYRRESCQQTVVHSALWRREGNNEQPMYIHIRPNVLRADLDVAVFSPTPAYEDEKEICELHDWIPENAFVEKTHTTKATFINWKDGPDGLTVELPRQTLVMETETTSFHNKVQSGINSRDLVLCKMSGLSPQVTEVLLEHNNEGEEFLDMYGKKGTRNSKRLAIVAAPSLLKCAAEGQLPLELARWYRLPASPEYGRSIIHVPPRPAETWRRVVGKKDAAVERIYDEEESIEYCRMLANRPEAFQVKVDRDSGKIVVYCDPIVAAHRAASSLVSNDQPLEVDYCLSELSRMGEPDTKVFAVPNSDEYEPTDVPELVLPLYPRQAKALTRMLEIESGKVKFSEEERSEHVLPGIGWCLIGKAAKKSALRGGVLGDAIGSGKTVVTIALILAGRNQARKNRDVKLGRSSATLIVVPPGLVRQWDDERIKFTGKNQLNCIIIDSTDSLKKKTVEELCGADIVIVPAGIIEEAKGSSKKRPYTENLAKKAGAGDIPPAPTGYSQREAPTIEGTWVRNMSSGPEIYVGNKGKQSARDAQAYYGHCYASAVEKLRQKKFGSKEKGVPIEYFTWERIVIDECHETLVTNKKFESTADDFKEKARRGAREFLGVSQTDPKKRPLLAAAGVWGLTGTPLLETESRITELANLMGGTYLTGAAHHWRKEERESGRDLFLNQTEALLARSREYRCAVQEACHTYVKEACQRNRGEKLAVQLTRETIIVNLSEKEGKAFLEETKTIAPDTFVVSPDQLGEKTGSTLTVTASSESRHKALVDKITTILDKEPTTKIIVFANRSYGGYESALTALKNSGKGYCHISEEHDVEEQNERISWFRHVDATEEERARPRVLLLSFEQAAGHNLQEACHNVIIYDPMYSGLDAVADASVEEQAVGRVMRQGQNNDVTCTRICVRGPKGERCVDDWIIERNLDPAVLAAATSNFD